MSLQMRLSLLGVLVALMLGGAPFRSAGVGGDALATRLPVPRSMNWGQHGNGCAVVNRGRVDSKFNSQTLSSRKLHSEGNQFNRFPGSPPDADSGKFESAASVFNNAPFEEFTLDHLNVQGLIRHRAE